MSRIVPLPVLLPLLGAGTALVLSRRRATQRVVSVATLAGALASSVALAVRVDGSDGGAVARLGGWPSAIGITYVADRLAVMMLIISCAVMLVVLAFAVAAADPDEWSPYYHPTYLVLAAGVNAAFLAGDLFHLFVAFEVLLVASYVLMTVTGSEAQIRSGTTYVVLNVVESTVLLAAVGLVYAATGTLNMADLPQRLGDLDPALSTGLHLLFLVAFGMKAAVFPLFFWLPDSYPTAPSAVSAVFAGLLTKVGVYALIRTQTLLFPDELRTLLAVVAGTTMIIGVLGAIAQNDFKRILSFHIVSQIGYMIFGLALGGPAAVAATVYFLLHQIPIKTSLFLVDGTVSRTTGTSALERLGGLSALSKPLAVLFGLSALSLAGVPPLSGFFAKLGLVLAGVDDGAYALVAAALVGSLLTLVSMTKIWAAVFWGETGADVPDAGAVDRPRLRAMTTATAGLVGAGLVIALAAGPLYGFCERVASDITDVDHYREMTAP